MNFSDVKKWQLGNSFVSKVTDPLGNVIWEIPSVSRYFYIENISDNTNTITFKKYSSNTPDFTVYYSLNTIDWSSMGAISTTGISKTISPHSRKYFRAKTDAWGNNSSNYGNYIQCSEQFKVGGNIMSLLYGNTFNEQTEFPTGTFKNFAGLFRNNTNLVSASNLLLPATTANSTCYSFMFQGCTSLTAAPELPATTLANYCYREMFDGCTSLTETPALPATTLVQYCYRNMFSGCTNLTKVTTYANDISAYSCLQDWLSGVVATGDFYNLGSPAPTYPSGASGIPSGWTEHNSL